MPKITKKTTKKKTKRHIGDILKKNQNGWANQWVVAYL